MYRPEKYKKDHKEFIYNFIQDHPFATLISSAENLIATHVPVLVKGDSENYQLFSHIANHNNQLSTLQNDTEVLVIFHGAHSYISSSWYTEKDISTWDYQAVHINGKIKIQNSQELENSLKELVAYFEKDQKNPLYYDSIPKQMLEDHLPLITGFWIEPFKVQGIAKLHQNYNAENIENVVSHLNASEDQNAQQVAQDILKENNCTFKK